MNFKNFLDEMSVVSQCRRYGIPFWQCPALLFIIMGLVIIASALLAYAFGTRYIDDPQIVALIVLALTAILFLVSFAITRSFERLAEANRMKLEFVKIVSHQLRSPITNLSWSIDILMSGELGRVEKKQLEYYKILRDNSNRMIELVRDLITTSRLEEGSLTARKDTVSLENIIKNLIIRFKPLSSASNIEIKFDLESNLPKIIIDSHQIETAMENLIDNALRYTKGKGVIIIKLEKKDNSLFFEIKDNGIGIPKEDRKFIFKKFFRSANAIRQQTQGSGLGLFITKSIIERFRGKIGFQSEENKGTTFWFTLPIK